MTGQNQSKSDIARYFNELAPNALILVLPLGAVLVFGPAIFDKNPPAISDYQWAAAASLTLIGYTWIRLKTHVGHRLNSAAISLKNEALFFGKIASVWVAVTIASAILTPPAILPVILIGFTAVAVYPAQIAYNRFIQRRID